MIKRYLFYISENYSFQILRPLQNVIWANGDTVAWFVEGNNVDKSYFKPEERQLTSVHDVIEFNPRAVFVPGNLVPSFIPGLKVCVRHGFMGFKFRKKDGLNYSFIIRDCFDLYCSLGPSMTGTLKSLEQKHGNFKVVETGFCKMDPFFTGAKKEIHKSKKPTILFSSTFSPRMSQAEALLPLISELSKNTKWRWLVTFHPKMAQDTVNKYKAAQHENLTFVETDDASQLMVEADVMLGDNSSMLIEFMMLGKPVVTMKSENPKSYMLNVTRAEDVEGAIEKALTYPVELMDEIREFNDFTHPYSDGGSSQRILDATEDMLAEPPKLKPRPFNLIRNIKMRRILGYWRF
ncbi:CDP-glycerol glycerophosphotransferase family protein [Alteromonas sp. 5E99-2]|uniref:UDP-N-acetylglucosamine 2-epimerase n=1 Tax=Alteromonas sp. 5E99-2 TaxID=2817683 RepID=UPI001A996596|nr:UDP-N-acetylglucosamine 2-epimerase [Alteromonas sp. 5E99-2]MBO1256497.1 CDP-glycerol glycerophosphotransferase family protein [Alteromonas sp. 5E99-2]